MVELEGLEPEETGQREGQKEYAKDKSQITGNYFGLWAYLFSNQEWTWHAGTPITNEGWYKEGDYKQVVMPFAIDAAKFNGFQIGTTWQEAGRLIGQQESPFSGEISENLNYFLGKAAFRPLPA